MYKQPEPEPNLFRDLYDAIPRSIKLLVVFALVAGFGFEMCSGMVLFAEDFSQLFTLAEQLEQYGGAENINLDWDHGHWMLSVELAQAPDSVTAVQDTIHQFAQTQLHDIDVMVLCEPTPMGMTCEQFY